jgi:hypothetical protein
MTSLTNTASWIIVKKNTGKAIFEIFSKKTANTIETKHSDIYKVVPILQYLQDFNRRIK